MPLPEPALEGPLRAAAAHVPLVASVETHVRTDPEQGATEVGVLVGWKHTRPDHPHTFIRCGRGPDLESAAHAAAAPWHDGPADECARFAREALACLAHDRIRDVAYPLARKRLVHRMSIDTFLAPTLVRRLDAVKRRLAAPERECPWQPDASRATEERILAHEEAQERREEETVGDTVQLRHDLVLHGHDALLRDLDQTLERDDVRLASRAREALADEEAPPTLDAHMETFRERCRRAPATLGGPAGRELARFARFLQGTTLVCGRTDLAEEVATLLRSRGLDAHLVPHSETRQSKPLLDAWTADAREVLTRHVQRPTDEPLACVSILEYLPEMLHSARAANRADVVETLQTMIREHAPYASDARGHPAVFDRAFWRNEDVDAHLERAFERLEHEAPDAPLSHAERAEAVGVIEWNHDDPKHLARLADLVNARGAQPRAQAATPADDLFALARRTAPSLVDPDMRIETQDLDPARLARARSNEAGADARER